MNLELKAAHKQEYLEHLDELIDYNHPLVQTKIQELESLDISLIDKMRKAFHFVRDDIQHSFDTNSSVITISASDTIEKREGICFAKSHLLAALLRGLNVPVGFCYQR